MEGPWWWKWGYARSPKRKYLLRLNQVTEGAREWEIRYLTSGLLSELCAANRRRNLKNEKLPMEYNLFHIHSCTHFGDVIVQMWELM
jgi:hypothetical protein